MIWLVAGVLLWSVAHLFPSAGVALRTRVAEKLGPPYQGIFALVILGSVALMVLGWRSTPPELAYVPPTWGRGATSVAMFIALVLFAGSGMETNLKRVIRHPQLAGITTWCVGHLLSNGEDRSLVLFGGLLVWSIAAMVFINRRDGAWEKPEATPVAGEWKPLVAGIVAFALLYLLHPYFTGMPATPGF